MDATTQLPTVTISLTNDEGSRAAWGEAQIPPEVWAATAGNVQALVQWLANNPDAWTPETQDGPEQTWTVFGVSDHGSKPFATVVVAGALPGFLEASGHDRDDFEPFALTVDARSRTQALREGWEAEHLFFASPDYSARWLRAQENPSADSQ